MFTSQIQLVIDTYFPKNFKTTQKNLANNVWLNRTSNSLSYLTITGTFIADVPILLPSQFILVMNQATISVDPALFSSAGNTALLQAKGNAIINMKGSNFAGVVSPSGPSGAIIDCSKYPTGSNSAPNSFGYPAVPSPAGTSSATGPDGIVAVGSNNIYIDGIQVNDCGLTSANFAFFNTKVVEMTNCVSTGGGVRGIWVIITSNSAISFNLIQFSVKFGIDFDASSGPWTMVHSNTFKNNAYQAVFIEQGTEYGIVSNNVIGPNNQNSVSFFNNIYPELVTDHVILNNLMFGSTGAGLNVGSVSCVQISASCPVVVGFWPSVNSYIIGNSMWGNKKAGIASNGAATGFYYTHNNDTQVR